MNKQKKIKHPAKYTDGLLPIFTRMIPEGSRVLDPFAGTGKIHLLPFETVGVEIEPEWAAMHPDTICADSTNLPFSDEEFDVICTSPTYGNRMADSHEAKDGSKRNTYTHCIGRKLHENNTGKLQFGEKYKEIHLSVYKECVRVMKRDGFFILNVKNFIKNGEEVDVYSWHKEALEGIGFRLVEVDTLATKGNGFGANAHLRTGFEIVAKFAKNNE